MKITTKNYLKSVKEVGSENLPEALQKFHSVMMTKTDDGKDWAVYENDTDVKRVFDLAFEKLEEFINNIELSGIKKNSASNLAKDDAASYKFMATDKLKMIYRLEKDAELENDGTPQERKIRRTALEKELKKRGQSLSSAEEYDPIKEIHFIERFLAFNERMIQKNTVKMFIADLQKAIQEKKIRKHSPYAKQVVRLQEVAIQFYNRADNVNRLVLSKELLNDLYSVILDFENKISKPEKIDPIDPMDLSGVENETESEIMSSVDFAEMEFSQLGFTDKWLNLIGDPSPGFTAMVFGKPKMGKSYLCVDFAGYLARNFGKVLYVAKEEKLDVTLQRKLKEKDVAHENLFVTDNLPANISAYDFIFLDSVNLLGLSPEDLRKLKANNPGKGFIYIFQTTKTGNFRGANSFQHDVDIVIEIPEKGRAVQNGRYNQGGEMNIFEDAIPQAVQELSGVKKNEIEIDAELQIPLGELFIYIKRKGENEEDTFLILEEEPRRAIKKIEEIVDSIFRKKKLKIKVLEIEHSYNDSKNINHGVAYFSIKLKGTKEDLQRIAGEDKEITYDWDENLDGVKKKTTKVPHWTEPSHLNKIDHAVLKEINRLYKGKQYKEAMNRAMATDTIVREEIPGDIWKKMGGTLTKTGEEKLKAKNSKSAPVKEVKKKPTIVFNSGVRALKGVIEREWDLELNDGEYIEILDIAEERSENFAQDINDFHVNLEDCLKVLVPAMKEWDKKKGRLDERNKSKFNPAYYEKRKDIDNPSFIFTGTSSKVLAEAIEGDFDLIHMVRRELANRGQDSHGKWVGFDEAKKIHRI